MKKDFKVVTIGTAGVGKTSIFRRYAENSFDPNSTSTVAYNILNANVLYNNENIHLSLWDTAGQEKYHSLIPIYLKGANACIMVFDLSDADSFSYIEKIWDELQDALDSKTILILCGNKMDLVQDELPNELSLSAQNWINQHKSVLFFLVSALNGHGIELLFDEIAKALCENEEDDEISPIVKDIIGEETADNHRCC